MLESEPPRQDQALTSNMFAASWAARMHNVSFGSPEHGLIYISLKESMTALLSYVKDG